ncbi:DUF2500 family protein [Paenibacillaceae bacterium]|nr:DUF2500 family protein [Paenibacillaceae bacterium]
METIIIFFIISIIVASIAFVNFSKPEERFNAQVIKKEEDSFKVMSASNKVTSYKITLSRNESQIVTFPVLNYQLYERVKVGDLGTAIIRGERLVGFEKRN